MSRANTYVRRTYFVALLAIAVASGCVTKGRYKGLQRKLDDAETAHAAEIQKKNDAIEALEAEVKRKDEKVAELETAIAAKEKELASLTEADGNKAARITQLESEKADLDSQLAKVVKDRASLKSSVTQMQAALAEQSARRASAERRMAQYRDLLARFKALIDAGKLRVRIVDGRMVLQLPADVLFASGSAKLSKDGKQAIMEISQVLAKMPDRRFQVEGHTDNVPIKTSRFPSNWVLAAARGIAVVSSMIEAGINPANISAASFGEFKPTATNDTPEGRAANRRIEIVVVPDLSQLPGFEELNKAVGG